MIDPRARRRVLASPTRPDPVLLEVAARYPTHAFLAGAAQGCYQRQVQLLAALFAARGRSPAQVRVLDWGAGKGHVSYLLRQQGFDVVSCDVRSEEGDSAFHQEAPLLREQRLDVVPLDHPWQLPFASGQFDLVVSFGVLEHVPHERESLREIARVLKPGGLFFFCFLPYWLSWTQRLAHLMGDRYHPRLYDVRGVRSMLADAGLKPAEVWHAQLLPKNPLPYSPAIERLDRLLTDWTPLKYLATNLEGFAERA
jgi:SAM-dependent methyltransferase